MIKAIIFDCFGVLVGQGFAETYRQAGGNPSKDKIFIEEMLGSANLGLITHEDMRRMVADRLGISNKEWVAVLQRSEQPKSALFVFASKLKAQGYKLAVLSNANTGTLQRKMSPEQLGVFDELIVSAEVGMLKPDRGIYLLAAERLGVAPEECVFTDDSKEYAKAAEDAGMRSIWFEDTEQFKTQLEKLLADTNN